MKITKVKIHDFLGISTFSISRLGKFNKITGANGVGKSALVTAIKEAFKSSGVDPHLIRIGADKAEILLEVDDRIKIERRITPTANLPKVTVNGQPMNRPQQYLNGLIGPFNFNPVEFFMAKPKERRALLLSAIPFHIDQAKLNDVLGDLAVPIDLKQFDFSFHGLEVLQAIQKAVYEQRHEQNLGVTRLKKSIEQDRQEIPDNFEPDKWRDFDISAKSKALADAQAAIRQHEQDEQRLVELREEAVRVKAEIERLQQKLAQMQEGGKALAEIVKRFERPDIGSLETEIAGYKDSMKLVNKLDAIQEREAELEGAQNVHAALDTLHKALTTDIPRKLLAEVKLPVENLEIDGDNILIDGKSIDKLSDSEQIRFAIDIARSLAGDLKVICVDRFESLDPKNRKEFEKATAPDEFEYFITVVTDGDLNVESTGSNPATQTATKGAQMEAGF